MWWQIWWWKSPSLSLLIWTVQTLRCSHTKWSRWWQRQLSLTHPWAPDVCLELERLWARAADCGERSWRKRSWALLLCACITIPCGGLSHGFHFDLLHLHLLLLDLLLLTALGCFLKPIRAQRNTYVSFLKNCLTFFLIYMLLCSILDFRPPGDVVSQGPPHSWSSPSRLASFPPGGSGQPPGAERESASGSSPPHEPGFCPLSVCPEFTGRLKRDAL